MITPDFYCNDDSAANGGLYRNVKGFFGIDSTCGSYTYKLMNGVHAPTHSIAIEWLRVNFGIQLFLDYFYYDGFHYGYTWVKNNGSYGEIWKDNEDSPSGVNTIHEATEAALLFTLNELIK